MKSLKSKFSMPILLGALLAGGGIVAATAYALPAGSPDDKPRCEAGTGQKAQSRQAMHEQRMAALKEKLQLAPEQEAAWNRFAASLHPDDHARMHPRAMHAELDKLNTSERIERMQALADERHASRTARAEAIKAFYGQLTPEQQKVFDAEATAHRMQRGHHHGRNA